MQTLQFVGWMIEALVATSNCVNDADLALNLHVPPVLHVKSEIGSRLHLSSLTGLFLFTWSTQV